MVTDASTPEIAGDNPNLHEIEAVVVGVRPDSDLNAVELEVLDLGAGFKTWLGPDAVLDLLSRLLRALTELLGRDDEHARCIEAKRLIETLARVGVDQRHIARRLGVSETLVSVWKRGRPPPSIERLTQLRRLVCGALRED